jgi:hypothetical protein
VVDVHCPQCGRLYHADESHLGKSIRCVQCGRIILLIGGEPLAPGQRSAAVRQARTPSAKVRPRGFRSVYAFAIAVSVVVMASVWLFPRKHGTPQPSNTAEREQPELNQQAESAGADRKPISRATRDAIANEPTQTATADARPEIYNSPPTGTRCEEDASPNGHGKLTVENGTSEDAEVNLSDAGTDEIVRCFFVQAHTSAQVAKIPQGTDRLKFATGLDWVKSEDTFRWHPSYSEFERALVYSEERDAEGVQYHTIRVTLHSVPSGNAKTRAISREEFVKGRRHVFLQRP